MERLMAFWGVLRRDLVAMVPRPVIEQQGRHQVDVHEIPDSFRRAPTALIRRRNAFCSPALLKFVEIVGRCQGVSSPTM